MMMSSTVPVFVVQSLGYEALALQKRQLLSMQAEIAFRLDMTDYCIKSTSN
jgi:hypothetical protein